MFWRREKDLDKQAYETMSLSNTTTKAFIRYQQIVNAGPKIEIESRITYFWGDS